MVTKTMAMLKGMAWSLLGFSERATLVFSVVIYVPFSGYAGNAPRTSHVWRTYAERKKK
jgi:hypothetical protein